MACPTVGLYGLLRAACDPSRWLHFLCHLIAIIGFFTNNHQTITTPRQQSHCGLSTAVVCVFTNKKQTLSMPRQRSHCGLDSLSYELIYCSFFSDKRDEIEGQARNDDRAWDLSGIVCRHCLCLHKQQTNPINATTARSLRTRSVIL